MKMASVGRGRGRGRGAIFLKDSKPGGLQGQDEIDQLEHKVKELQVDVEEETIRSCVEIATKKATSGQAFEKIIKTIYNPCYEDWHRSISAALICKQLAHIEADGMKMRDTLLRTIQADYKSKDDIRSLNVTKILGCSAFLCQVFYQLRGADGVPFKALIGPILEYVEMLLDNRATEEEIECACEQLLTVGPLIHKHAQDDGSAKLAKLKNVVRDKILDTNLSRDLRLCLIDLIEAFASKWTLNIIEPDS